jgi:hypothetical protein
MTTESLERRIFLTKAIEDLINEGNQAHVYLKGDPGFYLISRIERSFRDGFIGVSPCGRRCFFMPDDIQSVCAKFDTQEMEERTKRKAIALAFPARPSDEKAVH